MSSPTVAWLWILLGLLTICSAFNIDPYSPIAFTVDALTQEINHNSLYFGFSLSFYQNEKKTWLLVGAPKANTTLSLENNVSSSGCAFKCLVENNKVFSIPNSKSCELLSLDNNGNEKTGDWETLKQDQWLGVSLDSSNIFTEQIVACGYRTKYQKNETSYYFGKGICYLLNGSDNAVKISMAQENTGTIPDTNRAVYKEGFAQMGMSVQLTTDGNIVIGAPGMWQWKGGVVIRMQSANCTFSDTSLDDDSYLGYSVRSIQLNSAIFDAKHWFSFVSGAPRNRIFGQVTIFGVKLNCDSKILNTITGDQFGSYFGASLAVTDINDDGLDDVFIGAPMYNQSYGDEGAVYVYINDGQNNFTYASKLTGSGKHGARFGTAIASVDDVNLDGFKDVIIGAPYEDQGVVYLYFGCSDANIGKYSQLISAREMGLNLQRFGYTLASNMGGNVYPYVAVGAYSSDTVIILRTRPVHKVMVDIQFSSTHINWPQLNCSTGQEQAAYLDVTVLFNYSIPDKELFVAETSLVDWLCIQDLMYDFHIDSIWSSSSSHGAPRGYFDNKEKQRVDRVQDKISFTINNTQHPVKKTWTVVFPIPKQPRNIQTPVSFYLNMSLPQVKSNRTLSINTVNLSPILDAFSPQNFTAEISFNKECGSDDLCEAELSIILSTSNDSNCVILGSQSAVSVKVTVYNSGESAYGIRISVLHPAVIPYDKVVMKDNCNLVTCKPDLFTNARRNSSKTLLCDVEDPVQNNGVLAFHLFFDISDLDETCREDFLEIFAGVNDTTVQSVKLPVRYEASLTGFGKSNEVEMEISLTDNKTAGYQVIHTFDIRNDGPGLMPLLTIDLALPDVTYNERVNSIIKMIKVTHKGKSRGVRFEHILNIDANTSSKSSNQINENKQNLIDVLKANQDHTDIHLDCELIFCQERKYNIRTMNVGDSIDIRIEVVFSQQILSNLKEHFNVTFTSFVKAYPGKISQNKANWTNKGYNDTQLKIKVQTHFLPKIIPKSLPAWVIVICIATGLLHLIALIFILKKCGFFQRRDYEKLQQEILQKKHESEQAEIHNIKKEESVSEHELQERSNSEYDDIVGQYASQDQ